MEPNRHIIMQQTLDVALSGSESDGMALHRRLPDLCAQRIVPAIELVLNRYTPRNGFLTIDRLEIDAGSVSLGNLERELPRLVAQALEKVLQDMPYTDRLARAAMSDNIRHKTEPESITEAFLFFLENGTLPWSFRAGSATELESIIQKAWREAEKTGSGIRNIKTALLETLRSPAARARLIRQFTPAFLETMLGIVSSEGKRISSGIREIFERADTPKSQTKRLETLMWEQAFLRVASGKALMEALLIKEIKSRLTVSDLHEGKLETLLARYWPDDLESVAGDVSSSGQSEEVREIKPYQAKEQQEAGGKSVSEKQRDQQENGETPGKTADVHVSSSGKSDRAPHADASNIITESSKLLDHAHPDKETGIYIDHAGLVLLHPFLPRFFKGLGIAGDERLQRPNRALYLLHFLATGEKAAPEYELVIPKILCGVPVESVTEPEDGLRAEEEEEALALLSAVIRHWEALKNTGPDGLRETFLKRPGKVRERHDGDWLLQVEARGYDILLEMLPWGISMIKLPWMRTMLWVEWLS